MWIQMELWSETAKLGVDLYLPWPLTSDLDLCMDVTYVIGNNSWKFHDDTMKGHMVKRMWQTGGQTDWTIRRAA